MGPTLLIQKQRLVTVVIAVVISVLPGVNETPMIESPRSKLLLPSSIPAASLSSVVGAFRGANGVVSSLIVGPIRAMTAGGVGWSCANEFAATVLSCTSGVPDGIPSSITSLGTVGVPRFVELGTGAAATLIFVGAQND